MATRTHRWSLAGHRRVPRTLHPIAWWIWAIGLATAAGRTTNPILLLLLLGVLGLVVVSRRSPAVDSTPKRSARRASPDRHRRDLV